jgi:hypothetical protein
MLGMISLRIFAALWLTILAVDASYADCSSLRVAAQQHANDMARRNSLDHLGFIQYRASAGAIAENVAMGCDTEACARRMWMQSPAHRHNMMLGGCVAVASAVSAAGRRYWAMEIGDNDRSVASRARVTPAPRRVTHRVNAYESIPSRDFSIDGSNAP